MQSAFYLLSGFVLLIAGGEMLVRGSGRLALRLGMSPLVIALTVVAFGSSAPELVAGLAAGYKHQPGIVLGNVLGSNLANIALVIGLAALLHPVQVHPRLMRSELPFLVVLHGGLFALLLPGDGLDRWEGGLLAFVGVSYVVMILRLARRTELQRTSAAAASADLGLVLDVPRGGSLPVSLGLTAAGLALLPAGAHLCVTGATAFAQWFGLSDRVIGLTVISVGTSLPEIATSLIAVWHRNFGLAAGTVMGSNVFNICYVLGLTSFLFPVEITTADRPGVTWDLSSSLGMTVLLYLFCLAGKQIGRVRGLVLVAAYGAALTVSILRDSTP